jgi:hypothetical protein
MLCRKILLATVLAFGTAGAGGCHTGRTPELTVLGVQDSQDVVVVQVTNPASRPMRLTKLQYSFASSSGETVSEGEMPLSRDLPPGAAIVVEVPMDLPASSEGSVQLRGLLTAVSDEIVKTFRVSAQVQTPPES